MKSWIETLESRTLMSGAWSTVDHYEDPAGMGSAAWALTVGSSGQMYAAGTVGDGRYERVVVRKSIDGGATWSALSEYAVPDGRDITVKDIEVDAAGNLFTAGCYFPVGSNLGHWIVHRSQNGGQTWASVDVLTHGGNGINLAKDVTADAAGNLYAVGYAQTVSGGPTTWVVPPQPRPRRHLVHGRFLRRRRFG